MYTSDNTLPERGKIVPPPSNYREQIRFTNQRAVIAEGYRAPLDLRSTRELIAEQRAKLAKS